MGEAEAIPVDLEDVRFERLGQSGLRPAPGRRFDEPNCRLGEGCNDAGNKTATPPSKGTGSSSAAVSPVTANADTNILPVLWYFAGLPKNDPNSLRDFATAKLKELYAAAYERRTQRITLGSKTAAHLAAACTGMIKPWN